MAGSPDHRSPWSGWRANPVEIEADIHETGSRGCLASWGPARYGRWRRGPGNGDPGAIVNSREQWPKRGAGSRFGTCSPDSTVPKRAAGSNLASPLRSSAAARVFPSRRAGPRDWRSSARFAGSTSKAAARLPRGAARRPAAAGGTAVSGGVVVPKAPNEPRRRLVPVFQVDERPTLPGLARDGCAGRPAGRRGRAPWPHQDWARRGPESMGRPREDRRIGAGQGGGPGSRGIGAIRRIKANRRIRGGPGRTLAGPDGTPCGGSRVGLGPGRPARRPEGPSGPADGGRHAGPGRRAGPAKPARRPRSLAGGRSITLPALGPPGAPDKTIAGRADPHPWCPFSTPLRPSRFTSIHFGGRIVLLWVPLGGVHRRGTEPAA